MFYYRVLWKSKKDELQDTEDNTEVTSHLAYAIAATIVMVKYIDYAIAATIYLMLVNNQLDALFSKCIYFFYFTPLHVSSSKCSSSGGSVCINTPSGTTYSRG